MKKSKQKRNEIFLKCLGQAIRNQRLAQVISQEKLGKKCDLHRTYITDIESGFRNLSVMTLKKVAEALSIPMSELLVDAERLLEENLSQSGKTSENHS